LPMEQQGELHHLTFRVCSNHTSQPKHSVLPPLVAPSQSSFLSWHPNGETSILNCSHLQLQPGQDKAKQYDKNNNTELHMG
jgi:hypothetical protein